MKQHGRWRSSAVVIAVIFNIIVVVCVIFVIVSLIFVVMWNIDGMALSYVDIKYH